MKKIPIFCLILLLALTPKLTYGASATDAGPYDSAQDQQADADTQTREQKQNSQTETDTKNDVLGDSFSNSVLEFLGLQTTSEDVKEALSDENTGSTEELPQGDKGVNFFKDSLLPSTSVDGKDNEDPAGLENTSKTKKKRERALVETATFGYALASIHKTLASRNLDGKKSIDKQATDSTNKTKNYSGTVSNNTTVKMGVAQIYNAIVLTTATNNMLTAISSAEYISTTNNMLKDMLFSSFGSAMGSIVGSWLD